MTEDIYKFSKIIEEISELNDFDTKSVAEKVVKFNEEFGEFSAEIGKMLGITHKLYDEEHLIEEGADALQNLFSIILKICIIKGISFDKFTQKLTIKNEKWRAMIPLYTKQ